MSSRYIFDKDFNFRKSRTSVWTIIRKVFTFFIATAFLAVLYYVIFALVFSTDTERRLKQENRIYEKELAEMERKERLLADVVEGLQVRDDRIYEEIFHTSAPNIEQMSSMNFFSGIDSIPDDHIVRYSEDKLAVMETRSAAVEDNFRRIFDAVETEGFVMPPMSNPLDDFSFAQTGASIGEKINPFYKVKIMHNGIDLIAPSGNPVYAAADGVVSDVVRSRKGLGNVVVIDHGNGYFTKYAHLEDVEVRKGRRLKRGARIGYVGVSGNSFAPHLHYEVQRDTVILDPVHYFFACVTPDEYVNMMIMSASTGQSMD